MVMSYVVRKMELSDVNQVVNVHVTSFQGFFLTILGVRLLRLLYSFVVASLDGIGYVCVNKDERIVGFVCGTTKPLGFYRRFFKRKWRNIILAILLRIIRNPSIAPRLVWRVLNPPQPLMEPEAATLMSIAVDPKYRNKEIGKLLVQEFLREIRRRGVQRVNLTTDKEKNDAVNTFYQHLGFRLVRSFATPEGRWMNEYIITLSEED